MFGLTFALPLAVGGTQLAHPDSIFSGINASSPTCGPNGLCPSLMQRAYNLTGFGTGTGQTIVIVDACKDPSIASDLSTFDSHFGLPTATLNIKYPQGSTTSCSTSTQKGWDTEISLDVEWAHVMAPAATIDLLLAKSPSTSNLVGAWTYALNNHLGNQISNSWGGAGSCSSSMLSDLTTANNNHVTILASAGDSLRWGQGTSQTSQSPADCQNVLTVGGTGLSIDGSGNYLGESAWGTTSGCGSGGTGGGYVTGTPEPSYQSSVSINDQGYNLLGKPDVSADANPCTGVWVYDSQTYTGWPSKWGVVGGTSLSCPLWAGFIADVNQIRASNSFPPAGTLQTFLYDTVYVSGSGTSYASDFHDVTTGSNGWSAGTGWDAATGLGSFNVGYLGAALGTSPGA